MPVNGAAEIIEFLIRHRHIIVWQVHRDVFLFTGMQTYALEGRCCLTPNYRPPENRIFYKEVTLLGCKLLCQKLHDLLCTLIVYMPFKRSCIIQPYVQVPFVSYQEDCTKAEIYRRQRIAGRSLARIEPHHKHTWCYFYLYGRIPSLHG